MSLTCKKINSSSEISALLAEFISHRAYYDLTEGRGIYTSSWLLGAATAILQLWSWFLIPSLFILPEMYSIAKCIEMRQKRVWVWVLAIIGGIPWGYLVMGMYLPAHIGYSALGKTEPEYFAARKWYTHSLSS